MALFRSLIKKARDKDIELTFAISPVHSYQMELMRLLSIYPVFEDWKREIVEVLEEESAPHPDKDPFPLWDFSGYNSITTENFANGNSPSGSLRWYWEPTHYKREVGDLILKRILGDGKGVPDDFGVRLKADNIEKELLKIRADRKRVHAKNPEIIKELDRIWKETAKARAQFMKRQKNIKRLI